MATSFSLSFFNRKGGAAKTTATLSIGASLAMQGRRVVIVDVDPQASLTEGLLGPEVVDCLPAHATVAALFDDTFVKDPSILIQPTKHANLFLVPGSEHLDQWNSCKPQETGSQQMALREFVRDVAAPGQITLFDCGPTPYLMSWAALVASDFVIIPLIPEDYGAQGIRKVQRTVDAILSLRNGSLKLAGYLLTTVQARIAAHVGYENHMRRTYGTKVFKNMIPQATSFKEAVTAGVPLPHFAPRSTAAKAVHAVATELLDRVAELATVAPEFLFAGNRRVA